MRLIDADAIVHWQTYDDEHETFPEHTGTIAECLDAMTDEGCPEAIESVPSAQPGWIPCSERLPKKSGQYYVSGGDKVWICKFLIIPNFKGGWCNDIANPVVQAWMPLPEPWEGEQNG